MCFLRPQQVKKIVGKQVVLENDIQAIVGKKVGKLEVGDRVTVYGNLVIEKINETAK